VKKIICITGASSGFGEACAFKFSENHYDLIIAGRREEKLNVLKETLEKNSETGFMCCAWMCRTEPRWRMLLNPYPMNGKKLTCS
jgi:short-subunit dehydrogenase